MTDLGEPLFEHDCSNCVRFATNRSKNGVAGEAAQPGDFYTCTHTARAVAERSVIYRYGNEPSEYASTPVAGFAATSPLILSALVSGLRLTENEVRAMLGTLLGRSATGSYQGMVAILRFLVDNEDPSVSLSSAIEAAVKLRPEDPTERLK